jgi:hypothetical protein
MPPMKYWESIADKLSAARRFNPFARADSLLKRFARYIAEWPKSDGTKGSASFSVNLYGEEDAFELARVVLHWRHGARIRD